MLGRSGYPGRGGKPSASFFLLCYFLLQPVRVRSSRKVRFCFLILLNLSNNGALVTIPEISSLCLLFPVSGWMTLLAVRKLRKAGWELALTSHQLMLWTRTLEKI